MSKIIVFISLTLIYFANPTFGQKLLFSIHAGENVNFLNVSSKYEIEGQNGYSILPSYNFGTEFRTNYEKWNMLFSVDYVRLRNKIKPDMTFTDIYGDQIGGIEAKIINQHLNINPIVTYNIVKGLYIGTGLTASVLITSKLRLDSKITFNGEELSKVQNNTQYQRAILSIPFQIGYNFGRINIFSRFNKGFMNRIKGDTYSKEIDNYLMICVGYQFNKD